MISIHAPHTGRDYCTGSPRRYPTLFQSTRPIRGATVGDQILMQTDGISIHAPHTGRDLFSFCGLVSIIYFNPRAPYGARPKHMAFLYTSNKISIHAPHTGRDSSALMQVSISGVFQSTRPIRGATQPSDRPPRNRTFQSTRPIRGATEAGTTVSPF